MKRTMKLTLLAILGNVPFAFAAAGEPAGIGLGAFIFLGFVAVIIVAQAIPGLILFVSMLKGLFGSVSTTTSDNHPKELR